MAFSGVIVQPQLDVGAPQPTLRQEFLRSIRSSGKRPYKRYLGSPLRYAGGKSLAVGLIVSLLPDNLSCLVSPFLGGGSVEIACAKHLGIRVLGYDVFDILCAYWQEQLAEPELLYRRLASFPPDRATFAAVKKRLTAHWKNEATLAPGDLAAHYYFNSNTSYGPHFLGWPSDVYLNQARYATLLDKVRRFRASSLYDTAPTLKIFRDGQPLRSPGFRCGSLYRRSTGTASALHG